MAIKIFQTLRDKVQATNAIIPVENRAIFWYKQHILELTKWQRRYQHLTFSRLQEQSFTKQLVAPNAAQPGFFYFYLYDPKGKQELPYYDRFPFILCLDNQKVRFRGLNFHYLDYLHRARLFDALYPFREGRAARPTVHDIRMRLRMSYHLLKISSKYRAFRPCFKEYLVSNVRTPLLKVGAEGMGYFNFSSCGNIPKTNRTVCMERITKND